MPRRALRLTTDSPEFLVPVADGAILIEEHDGSVTVAVRLHGDAADAARRRFRAAQADRMIVRDAVQAA